MTTTYRTNVTSAEQAKKLTFHLNVNYPTFDVNFDLRKSDSLLSITTPNQPFNKSEISDLIRCLGFEAEQASKRMAG